VVQGRGSMLLIATLQGEGSPLKPGFGLSGDFISSNSVIPTGTDHRESGDLWSGGTLCLLFASNAWRAPHFSRVFCARSVRAHSDFPQPSTARNLLSVTDNLY